MRRSRNIAVFAASLLPLGLALSGCGSSGASPTSGADASAGFTAMPASALQEIADYTHSTPGAADATATPFVLGYVNQQGGATGFKQYTSQVTALVKLINEQLGGVGGHPVELRTCFVTSSEEEAQACAQQFASDQDIKAVLNYPLITGGASFHRIMDSTGIPLIGPIAASEQDGKAPNGFYDVAPTFSGTPVTVAYVTKKLNVKKAAVIAVQGDALSQFSSALQLKGLQQAGVEAKLATLPAGSSDSTTALLAAGAQDADVIIAQVGGASQCLNIAKTLKTLGLQNKKVFTTDTCADESVKQGLGDYPQWSYLSSWPSTKLQGSDDRESGELAAVKAFFAYLGSPAGSETYVAPSMQGVLSALRWINTGGGAKATHASIIKAARGDTGPMYLGPDTIKYGGDPRLPAVPGLAQRIYAYQGSGQWVDAAGGWFSAGGA